MHWALADAFTVCDHYFCSVLGPTDPNRLYWISGTIDPEGRAGGPLLYTPSQIPTNKYSWKTYPEALQDAGVSWKVYADKTFGTISEAVLSGMLPAFKNFQDTSTELYQRGVAPSFPNDLQTDVRNNTLPSVSWIVPNLLTCEHPALPPAFGAQGILQVLDVLTSNPAVWEKTALIVSYDENGGFFDHVPPPVAPAGTTGEYVSVPLDGVTDAAGISGPIGLGFRVPALIVSPYSRGGLVASDVFDHTSQLRLVERRFGVPVPNLSAWRRESVGDLTSAFNFAAKPDPAFTLSTRDPGTLQALLECRAGLDTISGTFLNGTLGGNYPAPATATMPAQATTPVRRRPSGLVRSRSTAPTGASGSSVSSMTSKAAPGDASLVAASGGSRRPATVADIPIVVMRSKQTRVEQYAPAVEAEALAAANRTAATGSDATRTALAASAMVAAGAVIATAGRLVPGADGARAAEATDGAVTDGAARRPRPGSG